MGRTLQHAFANIGLGVKQVVDIHEMYCDFFELFVLPFGAVQIFFGWNCLCNNDETRRPSKIRPMIRRNAKQYEHVTSSHIILTLNQSINHSSHRCRLTLSLNRFSLVSDCQKPAIHKIAHKDPFLPWGLHNNHMLPLCNVQN